MITIIAPDALKARERLHHFIDEMEDTRAINLYEIFKTEIEEFGKRFNANQNGEESYSKEEADRRTHELLKFLGTEK